MSTRVPGVVVEWGEGSRTCPSGRAGAPPPWIGRLRQDRSSNYRQDTQMCSLVEVSTFSRQAAGELEEPGTGPSTETRRGV